MFEVYVLFACRGSQREAIRLLLVVVLLGLGEREVRKGQEAPGASGGCSGVGERYGDLLRDSDFEGTSSSFVSYSVKLVERPRYLSYFVYWETILLRSGRRLRDGKLQDPRDEGSRSERPAVELGVYCTVEYFVNDLINVWYEYRRSPSQGVSLLRFSCSASACSFLSWTIPLPSG